ncbi:MAG: DNA mismatch repair protein MutH [Promethearchaeota archaeon]
MRVAEVLPRLDRIVGRPFGQLFEEYRLDGIIVAKGKTGKLLEQVLGLSPGARLRDFEDGELKTNKARADGYPRETMFISQISSRVDDLFGRRPFRQSWLYRKIRRIVYIPVVKQGPPEQWYFLCYYDVRIEPGGALYGRIESDYHAICEQMIAHIEQGDGMLHTSSGRFIQIRTKDAKPYNPIYSERYGRYVSNKNFAFYFKKDFMLEVQRLAKGAGPVR